MLVIMPENGRGQYHVGIQVLWDAYMKDAPNDGMSLDKSAGTPNFTRGASKFCKVQSPAVATQHLRPAGSGHVIPTTASARPVLPALPCGQQSKHHVTWTNEVRLRDWWAERALHPAQILHSPAHWVGRADRGPLYERPEPE